MAHTSAYDTLDHIVRTAIDLAEEDISKYTKYLKLGIWAYTNLRLNHIKEGEIVEKLSVDSDLNTVDFPDDMIDYIAIGIPIDGVLWTFTRKYGVIKTTTLSGGSETYDTDIGEGIDLQEDTDNDYSARGGVNDEGYFDVDYENSRFVLKNTTATTVWLAYTTSGIDLDETEQYIPKKYEEVIRYKILLEANRLRRDVPDYFIRRLEVSYENAIMDARNSELNLKDINDIFYELFHLQRRI